MAEAFDADERPLPLAELIRTTDWSRTPLGAASSWPQSLRTAASICIDSGFPMLVCWGPELVMIYNDGYVPVLGSKHPRALGMPLLECWSEIRDMLRPMFGGVMETGRAIYASDLMFPLGRHRFTEECYFTFSYSPIRDEGDRVGGVLVTCTETTRRVLGERRMRTLRDLAARSSEAKTESEAWQGAQQVLAQNPYGLPFAVFYSVDGSSARRVGLCGLAPDSPAAPQVIDLTADSTSWPIREAAEGRVELVGDVRARFGELRGIWPEPVEAALVLPVTRPALSRPYGILIAGASPRLQLDDDYRAFFNLVADQIATAVANARAHEEERERAQALAELDRAKTTFFGNVSHEFRTPLTLMLAPLDDVLRLAAGLPAEARAELAMVRRNGQRLLKLVNTLLDFSRIEAGRMEASFEPVDLAAVTADLASVFRSAIERAGLAFEVDCERLAEPVYVDRDLWEKIVFNLLSNAFKFTLAGRIAVRLRRAAAAVEVAIEDTGEGIPASELPRLFERFHRVESTRGRTQEGTGIGLALVQELVKLHGGTVRVESTVGRGSVFTVSLPLGSAHLPADRIEGRRTLASTALGAAPFVEEALRWVDSGAEEVVPAEAPAAAPAPAPIRRARIVLADDNADMRVYLARLLGQRWTVEAFADGATALAAVRAHPPDLVLSDVMMPGLDGFALLAELREDRTTAAIPVMLISARAGDDAQMQGRAAGADDYLVKPFSSRELLARVESQLALAALRRGDEVRRDDLRRLFMDAPAFVALLRGPNHVFDLVNDAYWQLVGQRDLIGRPVREVFPEIEGQGYFELLDEVFRTGRSYVAREARMMLRRAGAQAPEEVFLTFTYQPFREADGTVGGIVAFGFDVTELVRARQLAQVADRRKDEFIAMLSHELRNPLAPIATAVQVMKLRGEGSTREREVIERHVAYLARLVDDLLDVSRIASGKFELRKRPMELSEAVDKAVEIASPLLEERRHQLVLDVPRSGLPLHGDPVRLAQLFANLLTNAAKYTPAGGHIRVAARAEGGEVVATVTDDGVGVPEDLLPRIFDLFVQGRRAPDRAEGGLGLGLALVKSFAMLHGGSVSVRSGGGTPGSEFTVRLPLCAAETAAPAPPRPQPVHVARRVLVVDDNRDGADMLAEALRIEGHDVTVAYDGPEALARLRERRYDVSILDLGLPIMDGYELAQRIRAQPGSAATALIAITGYGQEHDRARTAAAGFDLHLVKPVELQVVLHAVDSVGGEM